MEITLGIYDYMPADLGAAPSEEIDFAGDTREEALAEAMWDFVEAVVTGKPFVTLASRDGTFTDDPDDIYVGFDGGPDPSQRLVIEGPVPPGWQDEVTRELLAGVAWQVGPGGVTSRQICDRMARAGIEVTYENWVAAHEAVSTGMESWLEARRTEVLDEAIGRAFEAKPVEGLNVSGAAEAVRAAQTHSGPQVPTAQPVQAKNETETKGMGR